MPEIIVFNIINIINAIYLAFVAPVLFKFWLIPKIERRYNEKLVFDNPVYNFYPFLKSWGIPPLEISLYLIDILLFHGKFQRNKKFMALSKIKYDIKNSSKVEIIIAWITFLSFIYFLISILIFLIIQIIYKK